jgi:hypothetical protein
MEDKFNLVALATFSHMHYLSQFFNTALIEPPFSIDENLK